MLHTMFGSNYLAGYLGLQKTKRKWYKIFTLTFSTGGVLGWPLWEYAPIIACILITVMQLVTLLENHIVPSDQDIENVADLRNKYITYFNKLEKLWTDLEKKVIDEHTAREQFYHLRQFIWTDIEAKDNELNINDNVKSLKSKADTQTRNYFKQYHS